MDRIDEMPALFGHGRTAVCSRTTARKLLELGAPQDLEIISMRTKRWTRAAYRCWGGCYTDRYKPLPRNAEPQSSRIFSLIQRLLTDVPSPGTNHSPTLVLLDGVAYPADGPTQSE